MRKSFFTLLLCLFAAVSMVAQEAEAPKEKAWKFDGTVGLNAAATGLVNWSAGGKNNVSGLAFAKLHLLYHKDAIAWETNFDTDFGLTWIDQKEDAFQKSSDNIKLATKFGWEFKPTWYLTVLGSFQSQYALGRNYQEGYNDVISKWLAPSYTDISVGIDWKKSVNGADFSIYLSPIAGRISTAYISKSMNDRLSQEWIDAHPGETGYDLRSELQKHYGTYKFDSEGIKQFRNYRAEFGLSFKGTIAYTYKDLKLGTTLTLFSPYQGKGFNVKEAYEKEFGPGSWELQAPEDQYFEWSNSNRHFGHFDVDWDVTLSYQLLKCLQISLQTNLKYYPGTLIENKDGQFAERVQFKGMIGLGVGYSF